MSGHSKWHSIKHSKGKADAARGKLFNRLIREITVAARMGGGDTDANPRLRAAVSTARGNNMPNKNIENAIAKGTGQLEGVSFEEIVFEAYGPGGVALVVESMTDNKNRTVAEVRHILSKHGGNIGATNSVMWMFNQRGLIRVSKEAVEEERLMEIALEAGADDMVVEDGVYEVSTAPEVFEDVRVALEKVGIPLESAELAKVPENTVEVKGDDAAKVLKLVDALDELDDTQNVFGNFDIDDEALEEYQKGK
ncbi:MAG: YebC/PmpR family DNA-binding transcriptional regulator [Chitinivibrionales bacterium]|nr:YebC/PmpR family DNA-binding transcriptional regulator [Chitinivibrionales bacterium]MBD3356034.1 YebC/PmpR family DNA-binding transcriptional regulator [Chitinivibrionales bacterium]